MRKLPEIKHVCLHEGPGYTSKRIPRAKGKPMPAEEVIARLKHLIRECRDDYHYVPSKEDQEAVDRACAIIEAEEGP